MSGVVSRRFLAEDSPPCADKLFGDVGEQADSGDEATPTTTMSDCGDGPPDDDSDGDATPPPPPPPPLTEAGGDGEAEPQLGPGLFADDAASEDLTPPPPPAPVSAPSACAADSVGAAPAGFSREETLFIFDWDDTILPSSWIQCQGLRLESGSTVDDWQRARLAEAASAAAETLRLAKLCGTVVLLTNAERGWIELSCEKFLPSLLPMIEAVKIVSARTSYEEPGCTAPLQWKVLAFEAEIVRACGAAALADPSRRKNIHSLGDSVHEREALLRATSALPGCRSKSLKFADRPNIGQLLAQHSLISRSFESIVQHDGNLDLCINC